MINGKEFEYALLHQFAEKLKNYSKLEIICNNTLNIAKNCFSNSDILSQQKYLLYASFAVNFLIDIEPRLSNGISTDDILQLEILSDHHGKSGDVRDILIVRLLQQWQIGISAKNNHTAVKHSRLSIKIDFGKQWLNLPVSQEYFKNIAPIFSELNSIRKESNATKKWRDIGDYHTKIYLPVLNAFKNELQILYAKNPKKVTQNLVHYLIGKKDFYKIIKLKNKIKIEAYNFNGSLNLSAKNIQAKYIIPQTKLPNKILNINFKNNSKTTIIVTMNNDWILSFRIHNASSKVEPSLKFDIKLLQAPKTLFTNILHIDS